MPLCLTLLQGVSQLGNAASSRALSVLAALAVPGSSAQSVAQSHGISRSTVERIKREARERGKPADTQQIRAAEAPPEPVRALAGDALSHWFGEIDPAVKEGIAFLRKAVNTLDPTIPAHVKLVSECVVGTLADVAKAWNTANGGRRTSPVEDVKGMSDDALSAAAAEIRLKASGQ